MTPVDDEFMDALHDAEEKIARSGGLKSNKDVIVDDEDDFFVDEFLSTTQYRGN